MILANHYEFPTYASLTIIVGMLVAGVIASMIANRSVNKSTATALSADNASKVVLPVKEEKIEEHA